MTELCDLTGHELARMFREREATALDTVESCLRRIETVEERIISVQRELADVDYAEGRNATARRRLAWLIQRSPLSPRLYLDLLKACLHPSLHAKLRAFRGMSTRAIC